MDVQVGDVVVMKKGHPCGSDRFVVTRGGMEIMSPRQKTEKNIKKIIRPE